MAVVKGELEVLRKEVKALEVDHAPSTDRKDRTGRDLDTIKDNQAISAVNVKQEIDRVYDINKWLLGAMSVSIITMGLSNFLKGRQGDEN